MAGEDRADCGFGVEMESGWEQSLPRRAMLLEWSMQFLLSVLSRGRFLPRWIEAVIASASCKQGGDARPAIPATEEA